MNKEAVIGTDLALAVQLLLADEVVVVPTETVYGLAGNAFHDRAVSRIFASKQRPFFDPLIVHIAERADLGIVADHTPAAYLSLMDHFWPGPLTLVFPRTSRISDLITSGLETVAVRMPAHPLFRELLKRLPFPLAAPSANLFGRTSPTTAMHVAQQLGDVIPYILDGGPCQVGVESTIVRWTGDSLEILRPGGISREQIQAVTDLEVSMKVRSEEQIDITVPGQLPEHYAPRTPLLLATPELLQSDLSSDAVLCLNRQQCGPERNAFQLVELSPSGDLQEAAARFFAALHELDASGCRRILAVPLPESGLGVAMNDRLRRAAHQ